MERTSAADQEPPLPRETAAIKGSMPLPDAKITRPYGARQRLLQQNLSFPDIRSFW
jgi:hypothetical protein